MQYYIKCSTWKQIFETLERIKGVHTKNAEKLRTFVEAIFYVSRSGCQWRLLPDTYGNWRSIHARFMRWSRRRIWKILFKIFQKDPDTEAFMIDATIVRAHACAAGYGKDNQAEQTLGHSKGGFTTKIHALVDGLGNPLRFSLTAGQRNEITQGDSLIQGLKGALIIADKGYDSDAFANTIKNQACIPVIPPRKGRKNPRDYDKDWYKERHLIECFFGKIKQFRRVFSRFDKTAGAYLSFLYFTGTLIWLK